MNAEHDRPEFIQLNQCRLHHHCFSTTIAWLDIWTLTDYSCAGRTGRHRGICIVKLLQKIAPTLINTAISKKISLCRWDWTDYDLPWTCGSWWVLSADAQRTDQLTCDAGRVKVEGKQKITEHPLTLFPLMSMFSQKECIIYNCPPSF